MATCRTCKFFVEYKPRFRRGPGFGNCCINPPVAYQKNGTFYSVFPEVSESEWCGKYKSKASALKAEARFVPPTVDEVHKYCKQRKNDILAEDFCAFYESRNWMVQKNKMKDWKACVRYWERAGKSAHKLSKVQEYLDG